MSRYVKKKGNLLGRVVGLIAWIILLFRHTFRRKEWTYSRRPDIGHAKSHKIVSSGVEPEKYWVSWMFTPNHKIIPINTFIPMKRMRWFNVRVTTLSWFSGYKVWTSCLDGLYLLKNSTSDNTQLSFWVPDWPHANPRFVNNQVSMQCLGKNKIAQHI